MTPLEVTLVELSRALGAADLPYMVIGGVANFVWGEPRSTLDVDLTVGVPPSELQRLLTAIGDQLIKIPDDPEDFAADTGVLPALHRTNVRVDFLLSVNQYAEEALRRAVDFDVRGVPVKFCTPEDLILHKLPSKREKDRQDVQALFGRRRGTLDLEYLSRQVRHLTAVYGNPDIQARYDALIDT